MKSTTSGPTNPVPARRIRLALLTLVIVLSGCSAPQHQPKPASKMLRVAVIPVDSPDELGRRLEPLRVYLAGELGIPVELVSFPGYEQLLEAFHRKEIELVLFGGFTFVLARQWDGAIPIALRDTGRNYFSVFITRREDPRDSLQDFRGGTLGLGSRLSTSGHLIPRIHLEELGCSPEEFFSNVRHSDRHDVTAEWVRDGVVDIGALDAQIATRMLADGRISGEKLRFLDQTAPFPDHVWAAQRHLPVAEIAGLRDAFMALSRANPEHARILKLMGARSFLPTDGSEFASVEAAIARLGLGGRTP